MAAESGKRKAAMLLMTLDPETAREILSDYPQDTIQQIAMEMARIDARGQTDSDMGKKFAHEFCAELEKAKSGGMNVKSFINDLTANIDATSNGNDTRKKMQQAIREKDPFIAICSAPANIIVKALESEHPQTIALVLAALPPKMSTEILSKLNKQLSSKVAWKMAMPGEIAPKTRHRIGEMICRKIMDISSDADAFDVDVKPTENLRKVAMVLSGLDQEMRETLMADMTQNSPETAKTVKALMVTWEDIPRIYDRSLQEALRSMESTLLAKALYGADSRVVEKIRANISERAIQMLDEEVSLMQDPQKKEILEAREKVVEPLRTANETGDLRFIEE